MKTILALCFFSSLSAFADTTEAVKDYYETYGISEAQTINPHLLLGAARERFSLLSHSQEFSPDAYSVVANGVPTLAVARQELRTLTLYVYDQAGAPLLVCYQNNFEAMSCQ